MSRGGDDRVERCATLQPSGAFVNTRVDTRVDTRTETRVDELDGDWRAQRSERER